ncbi:MAG TPA: PQQ-dependent sugar dehydrogenase [Xanthomonadales bacterium]|nr:PQQ-dependent sugar dehydrogenase [Xanthomonadales bacterium]
MKKVTIIIVVLILTLAGAIYINSQKKSTRSSPISRVGKNQPPQNKNDLPRASIVAEDLEVPWAMVFLPDGGMLVTERPGRVRIIDKDGNLKTAPLLEIDVVKRIQGEGGLHGITIHPEFEKNQFVYLYYTYDNQGSRSLNRVSRYIFDGEKLNSEKIIVDKIPGALFHDGGRIKFGPDKLLYITTGDAQEPSLAQNRNSLAGKILRVTPDGKAAPGNPFGSAQGEPFGTLIYSYGHRNPQGITWDESGNLFETEHGSSQMDELNRIEIGKNYGWPEVRGDEKRNGLVPPLVHSGSDTWAPGGAAYLNGSVYFVGLRGKSLYQAVLSGNSATIETHFKDEFGRIRDVIVGPDNMLYITTSNRDGRGDRQSGDDKIIRVNPSKL